MRVWNGNKSLSITLTLLFLAGCSILSTEPTIIMEKAQDVAESSSTDAWNQEWETMINNLKHVSVITSEGWEVTIDHKRFVDAFPKNPLKAKSFSPSGAFNYTVLIWSSSNEPSVLLINPKGVQWDNEYYGNEEAVVLAALVRKAVSQSFFEQLNMDRMMLRSKDMDRTKRLPDNKLLQLSKLLREAQYISGKPRLIYPLYPSYSLEIDAGGKEIVAVDILSPTLFSVALGGEKLFFQSDESLLAPLKDEMSTMDYARQHPKYLFRAKDIGIVDQSIPYHMESLQINPDKVNRFEAKSLIHELVREIAKAEKTDRPINNKVLPPLTLEFVLDERVVPVYIYTDHYVYLDAVYARQGILNQIKKYVYEDEWFIKQRPKK